MDEAIRNTLREVYHLIKSGDQDAARGLIKPVLAADRDNIDAWWLAAHAAVLPEDRRLALVQVLRLNPDHAPARVMLARLDKVYPPPDSAVPGGQKRSTITQPLVSNRWIWNVVLIVGFLGLVFGSMALISGIVGLTWFDDTVNGIGEQIGIKSGPGKAGQLGTVTGGDPANPRAIPITQRKGVKPGDVVIGTLGIDEAHVWTFGGKHGDDVAAMLQFTAAGDARHVLELWDANGRRLAEGVGEINGGTITLVYTLTQTGQYALVLIGRPGGPRGDYALGVDVVY